MIKVNLQVNRFLLLLLWVLFLLPAYGQYGKPTGNHIIDKGDELYRTGQFEKAIDTYKQALVSKNLEYGSLNWAISKVGLGASLLSVDDNTGIEVLFDKGLMEAKNLPPEAVAYLKFYQAWGYSVQGDQQKRMRSYEEGLEIAQNANDNQRIALLSLGLSYALRSSGKNSEALSYANQAVSGFRKTRDYYFLVQSLLSAAISNQYLTNYKESEDLLLEAVSISNSIKNIYLLEDLYDQLGELFKVSGKYDKAILYFNKRLKLVENQGSALKISNAYNDIGAVYSYLGDGASALKFYNRSMDYRKKAGIEANPVVLSNIALVYHSLNEYTLAYDLFAQALSIFETHDNRYWIPKTLEHLADLHLDWNRLEQGLKYAEQAVEEAKLNENATLQASSYLVLARIHTRLGSHDVALPFYRKSLKSTKDARGFNRTMSLINLAQAFQNTGSDSAFYYADLAFDEIEWLRGNIYGDHLQTEVFRFYATFFFRVASWYIENENDVASAFNIVEKGKSRSLLDQISASISLESFVDEGTSLRIRQKGKEIDRLYRELEAATDPTIKKDLEAAISDARLGYEVILNEARISNPDFRKLESGPILSLHELQDKLDSETALVELATFDNKLLTIIASHNDAKAFVQEIPGVRYSRQYLSSLVGKFRASIQNTAPYDSIRLYSRQLFDLLVKPLSESFPEVKNMVIIPDVSLGYLPFEALVTPDNKYLVEEYNIKYLPSASLIKYIPSPHRNTTKELFAVAGSGFESGTEFNPSRSQADFASLPSTLMEVDSISSKFATYTLLKNEDVSEAGIKSVDLGSYRYLHFATHGIVNEDNPAQSGLILSKKNNLEGLFGEDGLLNSSEIGLLNLNADMVVLSACNTGYGRNVVGEGLLGLQRSFLKAGASSVVVSLWSVFDRSTAIFMSTFYENLTSYEEDEFGIWNSTLRFFDLYEPPIFDYKSIALRDAKLSMIDHPYYNHPIHWAPFIYVGK